MVAFPPLTCAGSSEAGSVILKIAYGYTTEAHKKDPLVDMVGHTMDNFAVAAVPGAFLVDIMPFRKCFEISLHR